MGYFVSIHHSSISLLLALAIYGGIFFDSRCFFVALLSSGIYIVVHPYILAWVPPVITIRPFGDSFIVEYNHVLLRLVYVGSPKYGARSNSWVQHLRWDTTPMRIVLSSRVLWNDYLWGAIFDKNPILSLHVPFYSELDNTKQRILWFKVEWRCYAQRTSYSCVLIMSNDKVIHAQPEKIVYYPHSLSTGIILSSGKLRHFYL